MATIKRNGKIINFDRIVAYGCSFTQGLELVDHEYFPEYTIDQVDTMKRKLGVVAFNEKLFQRVSKKELSERERSLSWANHVAQNFGVDYVNYAEPGASMQQIIFKIQRDLVSNHIKNTDLILFGITCPNRWFYFNNEGQDRRPNIGFEMHWSSEQFHKLFFTEIANDDFILYNYFNCLQHLNLLDKHLGGNLLGQYMHHTINDYAGWSKVKNEHVKTMIKTADTFENIIDPNFCFGHMINWDKDTHAFYHPKKESQEKLGKHIFEKLNNG